MQIKEVLVTFLNSNKKYSFNASDVDVKLGDTVVVDTVNGLELAKVVTQPEFKEIEDNQEDRYKSIIRLASQIDLKKYEENSIKSKEVRKKVQQLAHEGNLDMKVISVEMNLDATKYLINFISENRVDFRDLVKNLASTYKARIELRQIGARDETKITGGLGPCGRPCCCKLYLEDFEHSTIKMAKVQGLSLNPAKISGLCGRLMCCLAYENKHYSETFKDMPRINSEVVTKEGKGIAIYNNLLKKTVSVKLGSKEDNTLEIKEFPLEEIEVLRKNATSNGGEGNNA